MWFLEGSQKQLLKRCSFRRDHYVRTVASAAALMASLARSSEPGELIRYCQPTPFMEHVSGPSVSLATALITATELVGSLEIEMGAIGGCMALVERGSPVSCVVSTLVTSVTRWILSIVEVMSLARTGSSALFSAKLRIYLQDGQFSQLLANLPPLRRPELQSLRGNEGDGGLPLTLLTVAYKSVVLACIVPVSAEPRDQERKVLDWASSAKVVDLFETLLQRLLSHRKRAKQGMGTRTDQAWWSCDETSDSAIRFREGSSASVAGSTLGRHASSVLDSAFRLACEAFRSQQCSQLLLGSLSGVALCRNHFRSWTATVRGNPNQNAVLPLSYEMERLGLMATGI